MSTHAGTGMLHI